MLFIAEGTQASAIRSKPSSVYENNSSHRIPTFGISGMEAPSSHIIIQSWRLAATEGHVERRLLSNGSETVHLH